LLDPEIARRWSDFHRARATLFLTTAKANISKGAKPQKPNSLSPRGSEIGNSTQREGKTQNVRTQTAT
jgi:hypothetical protein